METCLPNVLLGYSGLDTNEKAGEKQGHKGITTSALYMKDIYTADTKRLYKKGVLDKNINVTGVYLKKFSQTRSWGTAFEMGTH